MRGKFITFEGIEGCGKSTQIERLAKRLTKLGKNVVKLREPGGTAIGEAIREVVKHPAGNDPIAPNTELLLMNASRAQLVQQVIRPALAQCSIVLCDRFYDSSIAYQGYGFNSDVKKLEMVSDFATLDNSPELTFYLDISIEKSISRRQYMEDDRIEKKGVEYLDKVRQGFLSIADKNPNRIITIDASLNRNKINNIVWNIVKEKYGFKD